MYEDVLILSLNHVVSLGTKTCYMSIHIHSFLMLHSLQHTVNNNEGTSSPHTCATVGDNWSTIWSVEHVDPADELQEWGTMFWDTMIWPCCELELFHFTTVCVTHL